MDKHPLYTISHVRLDAVPILFPAKRVGQGKYMVFWWNEVALGHLFLLPEQQPLSEAECREKTIEAILPALERYSDTLNTASIPRRIKTDAQYFESFVAIIATIISTRVPTTLPPVVPVSVIICTRNRASQLRRCLKMLQKLPCAPAEIVVVDNASTDNSTRDVCQDFAQVIYLKEPRAGLDIARNRGAVAAQHAVVAYVDDDVVVHPHMVYRVWETFQDPAVGAMTGLVLALELATEAQLIFEQHWTFNRGYSDKFYDVNYFNAAKNNAPHVWDIGAGANMAFRKSIFETVGYFNELLDVGAAGCSGDSEMWYRILLHGHTIHYNPRAIVYHEHRKEMAGLKIQLFYYMRGHVAAALIQQEENSASGYRRYLTQDIIKYYASLIRGGFPFYRFRTQTLWAEVKGLASGVAFYYRNRTRSSKS